MRQKEKAGQIPKERSDSNVHRMFQQEKSLWDHGKETEEEKKHRNVFYLSSVDWQNNQYDAMRRAWRRSQPRIGDAPIIIDGDDACDVLWRPGAVGDDTSLNW